MKEENKIVVFQLSALNCDTLSHILVITRCKGKLVLLGDDVMIKSGVW